MAEQDEGVCSGCEYNYRRLQCKSCPSYEQAKIDNAERPGKRNGDWIQTFTGKQFWPVDPRPEDLDGVDIAHALSMKCRFNGHSKTFYSVAQHSVYVSKECRRRWPDRLDWVKWGLLHDLAEAYLPDVPRPIKHMEIGILTVAERRIMEAAVERFGLTPAYEPREVKQIDNALLATESQQIMGRPPNNCDWFLPEPAADITIELWFPDRAELEFLYAWHQIEAEAFLKKRR